MQLYVITDRTLATAADPGSHPARDQEPHRPRQLSPGLLSHGLLSPVQRAWLLDRARAWAARGVDFVQLREKDLPPPDLLALARLLKEAMARSGTRLLLNAPPELAREAGADGVHLPGAWTTSSVAHARRVLGPRAVLSLACHTWQTPLEARDAVAAAAGTSLQAGEAGPALALFSPIFSGHKPHDQPEADSPAHEPLPPLGLEPLGLEPLRQACAAASPLPVYALGGITAVNAHLCLAAGAAGIAAIRLFAGDDWLPLVRGRA